MQIWRVSNQQLKNICDQAVKGCWWMPWYRQAKKDVITCEKLRGVGKRHRSGGVRMGKPGRSNILSSLTEYIGQGGETCRSDTSQQAEEKKSRRDSQSSGERNGKSLNQGFYPWGCRASQKAEETQQNGMGRPARQGESPVCEKWKQRDWYLSKAGHGKSGQNLGGPPSKAKY